MQGYNRGHTLVKPLFSSSNVVNQRMVLHHAKALSKDGTGLQEFGKLL